MPRVTDCRIGTPENHQIRPIADLAQRTGRLAHFLNSHDRWAVTNGGRGVDVGADLFGEPDRSPLSGGATTRESPNQWRAGMSQDFGGSVNSLGERRRLSVDTGRGARG